MSLGDADSCSDLCKIVYVQKAAAQKDAWAQRSVLRGAEDKVASTPFSAFSPFVPNFSLVTKFSPQARGKRR